MGIFILAWPKDSLCRAFNFLCIKLYLITMIFTQIYTFIEFVKTLNMDSGDMKTEGCTNCLRTYIHKIKKNIYIRNIWTSGWTFLYHPGHFINVQETSSWTFYT